MAFNDWIPDLGSGLIFFILEAALIVGLLPAALSWRQRGRLKPIINSLNDRWQDCGLQAFGLKKILEAILKRDDSEAFSADDKDAIKKAVRGFKQKAEEFFAWFDIAGGTLTNDTGLAEDYADKLQKLRAGLDALGTITRRSSVKGVKKHDKDRLLVVALEKIH